MRLEYKEELFGYKVDPYLKRKCELIAERITGKDKLDCTLLIEGDTGSGKTNLSVGVAYIVSKLTGREFNVDHIYFDARELVAYAKSTSEQILIWDEPALHGLKRDWFNKTQRDLIQLLFTARKKRHFLIFNIVKFNRFATDIIEQGLGMFRVYKPEGYNQRKFLYFTDKTLGNLIDDYSRKHKRMYFKHSVFRSNVFGYVLPKIIDEAKYEEKKDKAIQSIGNKEMHEDRPSAKLRKEWDKMLANIISQKYPLLINSKTELCEKILLKRANLLTDYNNRVEKLKNLKENGSDSSDLQEIIINNSL